MIILKTFFLWILEINLLLQFVQTRTTNNPIIINSDFNNVTESNNESDYVNDYLKRRKEFFANEFQRSLGSDELLNDKEICVNKLIMKLKSKELEAGFINPGNFLGAIHFFNAIDRINSKSDLFKIIQSMPKGAILHSHDTAMVNTDYIINDIIFSNEYQNILWYLDDNETIAFQFNRTKPDGNPNWITIADVIKKCGGKVKQLKNKIHKHISLVTDDPLNKYKDINQVWQQFQNIFTIITPVLEYEPVWRQYFLQALLEMVDDNVQYLEFRGILPQLFDLDHNLYSQMHTLDIYYEIVEEFKKIYEDFIGVKFIFGPNRRVNNATFDDYMATIEKLKEKYPNFVAGFDLVGQEDSGKPLADFIRPLLKLKLNYPDINFFFHAGETNWNGMSTDENLIDAILLGVKRIGHGYAITKHPNVMDEIKSKQIAIEVNPISNQILKLVEDNRNHPCTHLFANNYPVVISSDDPSFWDAKPLSHDFYIAFMGISSAHSDLRLLKKLARNSLEFSSLNLNEKLNAISVWERTWNEFINTFDEC